VEWLADAWDLVAHIDRHLVEWSAWMGPWFYAVIALVVFCETGLVVTPFLPGDSLLFTLGILAAQPGSAIDPWLTGVLLMAATLAGDNVNYWLGRSIGPRVFASSTSRLLNRNHLLRAQAFYEKHGRSTIVLARFVAIIRTFAPFVAGIGRMHYRTFVLASLLGATIWVWGLLLLGYWLGRFAWVRDHSSELMWAIMGLTIVLGLVEGLKARRRKRAGAPEDPA
jgi:membrane-associated protein